MILQNMYVFSDGVRVCVVTRNDSNIIIIIIIIIIIMPEMAANLFGWQPQMREKHMVCNLQLHHGN